VRNTREGSGRKATSTLQAQLTAVFIGVPVKAAAVAARVAKMVSFIV
jgi:hypothetical protein